MACVRTRSVAAPLLVLCGLVWARPASAQAVSPDDVPGLIMPPPPAETPADDDDDDDGVPGEPTAPSSVTLPAAVPMPATPLPSPSRSGREAAAPGSGTPQVWEIAHPRTIQRD